MIVDKENVAQLSKPGEVFGEMSVFSGKQVSASVQTQSVSQFYVVNPNDFNHALPKDRDRFLFLMYKIYSVVVADRLIATNEKAKQFEIANRNLEQASTALENINKNLEHLVEERTKQLKVKAKELEASHGKLEQQNAALIAGFRKVSDLSALKDKTLERIRVLSQEHLIPLKKAISSLEATTPGAKNQLETLQTSVDDLIQFIQPLTELYQAEKAIESKRVLIADPDRKQQLVARMSLGGTGVSLDVVSSAEEAAKFLEGQNHDLFICESSLSEAILHAEKINFHGDCVFLAAGDIQTYLEKLKALPRLKHVISRDNDDRTFTVKNTLTTVTKILNTDIFGIEKYMAWGVETHENIIFESSRRNEFIQDMCSKFSEIGVRGTILDRVQMVAEEMLMNAIYDAPVSLDGVALFNHLPRTVEVNLNQDQACKLRYASDGNLLAVSVVDPFGGLNKETIIDYLDSCYRGLASIHNPDKGGAGRGLHQIIETSDLTIFNVKKSIRTEVIALFQLDHTIKKDSKKPSFHYFFS